MSSQHYGVVPSVFLKYMLFHDCAKVSSTFKTLLEKKDKKYFVRFWKTFRVTKTTKSSLLFVNKGDDHRTNKPWFMQPVSGLQKPFSFFSKDSISLVESKTETLDLKAGIFSQFSKIIYVRFSIFWFRDCLKPR